MVTQVQELFSMLGSSETSEATDVIDVDIAVAVFCYVPRWAILTVETLWWSRVTLPSIAARSVKHFVIILRNARSQQHTVGFSYLHLFRHPIQAYGKTTVTVRKCRQFVHFESSHRDLLGGSFAFRPFGRGLHMPGGRGFSLASIVPRDAGCIGLVNPGWGGEHYSILVGSM